MASLSLGETYDDEKTSYIFGTDQGAGYSVMGVGQDAIGYSYNPAVTGYDESPLTSGISMPSSYTSRGTTVTTKAIAPDIAMPELGDLPEVDEMRIKRLTQTRSAAGQRALRSALRESLLSASYQDNPNVAALVSRKALEGFGQGIAETYTRAQAQATAEEARDRAMEIQHQQAIFNAAMQDYMARFGTEVTTKSGSGSNVSTQPSVGPPSYSLYAQNNSEFYKQ